MDATKAIIDRLILPTLVGSTVEDIPGWNLLTQFQPRLFGRSGITIFAISGVDIALWDLAAKRAGLPLCKLLSSENPRSSIPFYASLYPYRERKLVTTAVEEALQSGFSSVKLHEVGLDEIEACRSVLGSDAEMSVDVNCGWSTSFVEENRGRLEKLSMAWLEEPVFPPEDFEALRPFAASRRQSLPAKIGRPQGNARTLLRRGP